MIIRAVVLFLSLRLWGDSAFLGLAEAGCRGGTYCHQQNGWNLPATTTTTTAALVVSLPRGGGESEEEEEEDNDDDDDDTDWYREGVLLYNAIHSENVTLVQQLIHKMNGQNIALAIAVPTVDGRHIQTTPLHQACLRGNLPIVRLLLQHNDHERSNILESRLHGDAVTPLIVAAGQGHADIVRALLAHGADINAPVDDRGWTSLHVAVANQRLDVVEALIESDKVDCSVAEQEWGRTPLLLAIGNHHKDGNTLSILQALLASSQQLNLDQADKRGVTPLVEAIHRGYLDIVRELLQAGADANTADPNDNVTPLYQAVIEKNAAMVRLLLQSEFKVNVNALNTPGKCTALQLASQEGMVDIVLELLEGGAHVNAVGLANRITALFLAAQNGHLRVARELLNAGADVNMTDARGVSPLGAACEMDHPDMALELLARGAHPHVVRQQDYKTPLYHAAERGQLPVVQALIATGKCQIDGPDSAGYTPLHVASRGNHVHVVKELIDAGANLDAIDRTTRVTPLYLAALEGNIGVVQLLISCGAKCNASGEGYIPLHAASQNGHLEVVRSLIAAGSDINAQEFVNGLAPLHYACVQGRPLVVAELIQNGANVHICGARSNVQPLHLACQSGCLTSVQHLLGAGADVKAQMVQDNENRFYHTPASIAKGKNYPRIVEELEKYGA